MSDITNYHYVECPIYDEIQDKFPQSPDKNSPHCIRCIGNAIHRFEIMIGYGYMSQKNMQGEITQTRVALIRTVIWYCGILVQTLSQTADWSLEAPNLMKKGEKIIGRLREVEGEGGREKKEYNESLIPNASPYELVIRVMIEEQVDRNSGLRDQLS